MQRDVIGAKVSVIASRNAGAVGLSGVVIDETKNMLVVRSGSRTLRLEKSQHTFAIDGVAVQGAALRGRPEERIKRWIRGKA